MKSAAGTWFKGSRVQLLFLVSLSVVFSAMVVNRLGGDSKEQPGGDRSVIEYSPRHLPELLTISDVVMAATHQNLRKNRDPFAFMAREEPVPEKTTTATTGAVEEKSEAPEAREEKAQRPAGPRFDWTYLGFFGPKYLPVAAFRTNGDVEVAVLGQVVDESFILRRIGPESVALEVLGKPAADLMTVILADD